MILNKIDEGKLDAALFANTRTAAAVGKPGASAGAANLGATTSVSAGASSCSC
jgi:hypothetical protein